MDRGGGNEQATNRGIYEQASRPGGSPCSDQGGGGPHGWGGKRV